MGYMVATPTVIGILQSCEKETPWLPAYFSVEEGIVIRNLVDLILPKTDTVPGAKELNIPQFIDKFLNEVVEEKDQNQFRNGLTGFVKELGISGEVMANDVKIDAYDPILSKYLRASKEQQEEYWVHIGNAKMLAGEDGVPKRDDDAAVFSFLSSVRGLSIWGFKTHETIGKEYMAYDPIPGRQAGCIPLEDATGGKAYSL